MADDPKPPTTAAPEPPEPPKKPDLSSLPLPKTQQELEAIQSIVQKRMCELEFKEFVLEFFPVVEPNNPLNYAWYVDAIIKHLQAAGTGVIRKLIINQPPRTLKSTLTAVLFPCWIWTTRPWLRFICASYGYDLSVRDSKRRRDIIMSEKYQRWWGKTVNLQEAFTNREDEFHNSKKGYMISTSIGGAVTGRGGDYLILDDPIKAEEGQSEVVRQSCLQWLGGTWATRKDNPTKCVEILVMQRLHEDDPTGHYLKQGGWEHLKLPMEFEGERRKTKIFWEDPRREKGELLDKERFPQDIVDGLKVSLGPYGYSGQFQQNPTPTEGGIFKDGWFPRYHRDKDGWIVLPGTPYRFREEDHVRFATSDLAITLQDQKNQNDPDWTIMFAWSVFRAHDGPHLVLLDAIKERMEGPDILKRMKAFHDHWKFAMIGIETVAFQASLFQSARQEGLPVREISTKKSPDVIYRLDGDKLSRAYGATPFVARRRVWVPEYAPWLYEIMREWTLFPNSSHDDAVDALCSGVAIGQKIQGNFLGGSEAEEKKEPLRHREDGYNVPEDETVDPWDGVRLMEP